MEISPLIFTVLSILIQLALLVYFGGKLAQRVDGSEKRLNTLEGGLFTAVQNAAAQSSNIAVLTAKLDNIQLAVNEINRKIDRRR